MASRSGREIGSRAAIAGGSWYIFVRAENQSTEYEILHFFTRGSRLSIDSSAYADDGSPIEQVTANEKAAEGEVRFCRKCLDMLVRAA